jgi:hypothetical protein
VCLSVEVTRKPLPLPGVGTGFLGHPVRSLVVMKTVTLGFQGNIGAAAVVVVIVVVVVLIVAVVVVVAVTAVLVVVIVVVVVKVAVVVVVVAV